jgi:hypothetical protein
MTVNKANNYTQPTKRKQIFNRIKAANTHGTAAQFVKQPKSIANKVKPYRSFA